MEITKKLTIGEVVAHNFRAASVFKNLNIDFCCKGNRTIEEVCKIKNIDDDKLIANLNFIINDSKPDIKFNLYSLDFLTEYVVNEHHKYIEEKAPIISEFLNKIVKVHGNRHIELIKIERLFLESYDDLKHHLKKEEIILFPFIEEMVTTNKLGKTIGNTHFGSIEDPINMMKNDHIIEGERFELISELSNKYSPPEDACTTYKVAYKMLKEFEDDLHKHIHLENNIIFPKAINMFNEMTN